MTTEIEQYCYFSSPIGRILLAGRNDVVLLVGLPNAKTPIAPNDAWQHNPHAFTDLIAQLTEYFAGERTNFNINYQIKGTEFQQKVLQCVATVPYGATCSYSDIAAKILSPKAVRAVGSANATNPLPILIPCHRIIGKDGSLTGYGGGIEAKRYLLQLESPQSA